MPPLPIKPSPLPNETFSGVVLAFSAQPLLWYRIVHVSVSLVGCFYSPFFFVFHLLDYLRWRRGMVVVKSVQVELQSLALASASASALALYIA